MDREIEAWAVHLTNYESRIFGVRARITDKFLIIHEDNGTDTYININYVEEIDEVRYLDEETEDVEEEGVCAYGREET